MRAWFALFWFGPALRPPLVASRCVVTWGPSPVCALHVPSCSAELNLDYIMDNPWVVVPISALRQTNIDRVLEWLVRQK